jgi:hypothetical protein
LTIIPTGSIQNVELDEIHILNQFGAEKFANLKNVEIIKYEELKNQYIFDFALKRIDGQYGDKFGQIVRILLDYN